jgi:hypothetical protein
MYVIDSPQKKKNKKKTTSVLLHGYILFPGAKEINDNVQTFTDLEKFMRNLTATCTIKIKFTGE